MYEETFWRIDSVTYCERAADALRLHDIYEQHQYHGEELGNIDETMKHWTNNEYKLSVSAVMLVL